MTVFLRDVDVEVRPEIPEAFDREWRRLAEPGATWSGIDRVEIAAVARAARDGEHRASSSLPAAAVRVAAVLGSTPAAMTRGDVESTADDIGMERYVELVGVVARTAAVDTFHRGIGATLPELPESVGGAPSGDIDPRARSGPAWVPMVGGASIVHALSLVPAEEAAQEDLHGPLYLTYEQMGEQEFVRGLTRAQMELVAARTSAINECFY